MQDYNIEEWKEFGNVVILSVEDEGFNQEIATVVFKDIPTVEVLQAYNGKEALEKLENNKVDIVLLDLIMPEMDGFETLSRIRSNGELEDMPIIVVTSKEEERKRTHKLGANDFISKPFSPMELRVRVFNHLNIKKFRELMNVIEEDVSNDHVESLEHIKHIQESVRIADKFRKELLEKLGSFARGHIENESNKRLERYAVRLAELYGLSSGDIKNLSLVMSVYDIGLLLVPHDKLKNKDSREYQAHPKLGWSLLNELKETHFISMAKSVALSHHEHWDGSGFPEGIKEEDISIYARIVELVDFYDELTAKRIYTEEVVSPPDALQIMKRERGIKLDPKLLDLFVENFDSFRNITNEYS